MILICFRRARQAELLIHVLLLSHLLALSLDIEYKHIFI